MAMLTWNLLLRIQILEVSIAKPTQQRKDDIVNICATPDYQLSPRLATY